jgi:DNA modification methylase
VLDVGRLATHLPLPALQRCRVKAYYADDSVTLHHGQASDVLTEMRTSSVNSIVTSPPYWSVRDYGGEPGQLGLEPTSAEYIARLVAILAEAHRVLADDGTLWLNLGDTYAGKANAGASVGMTRRADRAELIPPRVNATAEAPYKSLLMIPERVAWGMVQTGWILRNRIVWNKPNAMPESVTDRLSSRHEALFLFVKQPRYWFDLDPIREPLVNPESGRMARRTSSSGLSGCRPGGTVLDPFAGSCTTGMVAGRLGRRFVGIELHQPYLDLAMRTRLAQGVLLGGAP